MAAATASFQRKRAAWRNAIEPTSSASMTTIPDAANAYQRRKANSAYIVSASATATRRIIGLTHPSWPCRKSKQADETLGQLERADDQRQAADVGHAARGDRERGREGDEHCGGAERENDRRAPVARKPRLARAVARQRQGRRRGVKREDHKSIDGA